MDLITAHLTSWILIGFTVIFLQRQSWWEYHYQLLFVPLGIIALRGIEICWDKIRNWSFDVSLQQKILLLIIILFPLFIFPLTNLSIKSFTFARSSFALNEEQQLVYQDRSSGGQYKSIREEIAFLKNPDSLKGDIYVCGNPLYYYLSGRNQAIPINGWALEFLLPEQWVLLGKQISSILPAYIFISTEYHDLIKEQKIEVLQVLEKYKVLHKNASGIWYLKT
ncbi:hypothetical protein [Pseudanabaena sp. 'Roaring Creek']|uniref:hypothetical protein n=1 Tax=Pseudanabaena sp. 'Roaring Creek' TaxID=1681830 RepID=UPI0006D7AE21|nr:hypothetical protein [Pseudanabaena sp. 'Roaring Creek']